MDYIKEYERWLNAPEVDEATKDELWKIQSDEKEIRERFGKHLEFGTGGLRGIMGAGTNRINKYTIRRATQGLSTYILNQGEKLKHRGVAIAYDCRHNGIIYALEAALVLAANGIKAYLFDELRSTPELSFAVRHLGTIAGIVITASHNRAAYNGYKVYWEDGGQLPPTVSDKLLEVINQTDIFNVKTISEEHAINAGLLEMIGKEIDEAYFDAVLSQKINGGGDISIVYSPLHGTGNKPIREVLKRAGFTNIQVVPEQELPDGSFPTVLDPNPEYEDAFKLGIQYAKEKNASLIFATDPDADRVGVAVRDRNNQYVCLTGNQLGALLTEYILSQKQRLGTLPKNAAVVSTIVSSKLTKEICKSYDVDYFEVYTGFKFIGEKIHQFKKTRSHEFVFGWEESYGYLVGTHARDKDAVVSSMMIAEMAQYLGERTLLDAMRDIYRKYGYYAESTLNIIREGIVGIEQIRNIMKHFKENYPDNFCGMRVTAIRDYQILQRYDLLTGKKEKIGMDQPANVLYFEMDHDVEMAVRPSGTEPKVKFYFFAKGNNKQLVNYKLETLKKTINKIVDGI